MLPAPYKRSENVDSPWLHFEAGALAQRVAGERSGDEAGERPQAPRLFTLLHGLTGATLKGPLGAYQATSTTEPDIASMIRSIAYVLADGEIAANIEETIIRQDEWTTFKGALDKIAVPVRKLIPNFESLFQRKTFHEPRHRFGYSMAIQARLLSEEPFEGPAARRAEYCRNSVGSAGYPHAR